MAYDSTQPQDDDLGISQPKLEANSGAIETYISRDHVSFDANTGNSGKHKSVTLVEGGAITTLANEMAIYAKETATISEAFIRRESDGDEIQLTGPVTAGANGTVFLTGGIIIKWGTVTMTTALHAFTFPVAFPNTAWLLIPTNFGGSTAIGYTVINAAGATLKAASGTPDVSYIAIGN